MKNNKDFKVLIIGSDINAYYMARSYHELYNEKCDLLARNPLGFTTYTNILNIKYDEGLWEEETFLKRIKEYGNKHKNKKVLVVSSNETYARFLVANKDSLPKNIVFNYPTLEIFDNFIMKDKFYNTYHELIDIPKTILYSCRTKKLPNIDFEYPVILKPANVIEFNHRKTPRMFKIYKLYSKEEIIKTIKEFESIGYTDDLLIQEFIPGDDSALFDAVFYCNQKGKVKLASFAQIGLQEHNRELIGNAAVLINGYNENNDTDKILEKLIKFMESIGFQGLAEFDLKYDYRDKKYKVLEINARQGRCSYYVTASGHNLLKYLIDDVIYNEKQELTFALKTQLLSFVPKRIVKKYIQNKAFKKEALRLWHKTKNKNPLIYKKDNNFKRKLVILKKHLKYDQDYKNGDWKQ